MLLWSADNCRHRPRPVLGIKPRLRISRATVKQAIQTVQEFDLITKKLLALAIEILKSSKKRYISFKIFKSLSPNLV